MLSRAAVVGAILVGIALVAGSCATLQEIAALRLVDFSIGSTSDGVLAGIDLTRVRSYEDLRPGDLLDLAAAARRKELPLAFTLHVAGRNPSSNATPARLVRLEWTLFLQDHETVSGVLDRDVVLEPGAVTDIPLRIDLDLVRFFRDDVRQLAELALGLSGNRESVQIRLAARPTVTTPLGPLRYPGTITIARKTL